MGARVQGWNGSADTVNQAVATPSSTPCMPCLQRVFAVGEQAIDMIELLEENPKCVSVAVLNRLTLRRPPTCLAAFLAVQRV